MYASRLPFGGGGRAFPLGIIGFPFERKLLPFTIGFVSREHIGHSWFCPNTVEYRLLPGGCSSRQTWQMEWWQLNSFISVVTSLKQLSQCALLGTTFCGSIESAAVYTSNAGAVVEGWKELSIDIFQVSSV